MLQPTNRLTLIEAMRPPAGFRFESAMAVTYTLDLQALLATPAAFALADSGGATGSDSHEPVELLHALRSHASKLTVFCQAGEIGLPPSRRVFAFLERTVVPVVAPRGGIVHPKVWVLRYEEPADPPDGQSRERRLRVLVASRNLTFDESWDTVVRLDESADPDGARLVPVAELFDRLLGTAVGGVSEDHRERVQSLSGALRNARFALPDGVDDLHVHILGLTDTPSPLPNASQRSLIISPFVSDDFFTRVHLVPIGELVSRPEQLDHLSSDALANVTDVFSFDDGSAPDLAPQENQPSPSDPGRPLVGLHAKVFAFEDGGRARLFVGSANATGPAFVSNVEILVELAGPTAVLGIDRLCDGSDDERGLRDLFNPYNRLTDGPDEPTGPSTLDRLRHAIARLPFEGTVEASDNGWSVTYRSNRPLPAQEGIEIHCWPLATAGNRRQVTGDALLEVRFETSLEAISGFLAFELAPVKRPESRSQARRQALTPINPHDPAPAEATDHENGVLTQFVVPVSLDGLPEHRERSLLRVLIGNAERFFRYLLALLDDDPDKADITVVVERISESDGPDWNGAMSLPVLEKLLRTMRRDPEKLAGLHPLVSDLASDDSLPTGFAELWEMIHDVMTGEAAAR